MLTGGVSAEGVDGYEEIPSPAPETIIPGGICKGKPERMEGKVKRHSIH